MLKRSLSICLALVMLFSLIPMHAAGEFAPERAGFFSQPAHDGQYLLERVEYTDGTAVEDVYLVMPDTWTLSEARVSTCNCVEARVKELGENYARIGIQSISPDYYNDASITVDFTAIDARQCSFSGSCTLAFRDVTPRLVYSFDYSAIAQGVTPETTFAPIRLETGNWQTVAGFFWRAADGSLTEVPMDALELPDCAELHRNSVFTDGGEYSAVGVWATKTGRGAITYGGASVEVTVALPQLGFYSTTTPDDASLITEWRYDGSNPTIYLIPGNGATFAEAGIEANFSGADVELVSGGAYATVTLTDPTVSNLYLYVKYPGDDDPHFASIPVRDVTPKLIFRYADLSYGADGSPVFTSIYGDDSQLLEAPPQTVSVYEFFWAEGGRASQVNVSDLSFPGDIMSIVESDGPYALVQMLRPGSGVISYQDSEIRVNCMLPDVGFYRTSAASAADWIGSWTFTGTNKTLYLAAKPNCTITSVYCISVIQPDFAISDDHKYVVVTLPDQLEGNYLSFYYTGERTDDGGSDPISGTAMLRIADQSPGIVWRYAGRDNAENCWYSSGKTLMRIPVGGTIGQTGQIEFFWRDAEGELTPLSVDALRITGDSAMMFRQFQSRSGEITQLNYLKAGDATISYQGSSLTVSVSLPELGFYSAPERTGENYLGGGRVSYDGGEKTVYFMAQASASDLVFIEASSNNSDVHAAISEDQRSIAVSCAGAEDGAGATISWTGTNDTLEEPTRQQTYVAFMKPCLLARRISSTAEHALWALPQDGWESEAFLVAGASGVYQFRDETGNVVRDGLSCDAQNAELTAVEGGYEGLYRLRFPDPGIYTVSRNGCSVTFSVYASSDRLKKVEASASTQTEPGNIAYYLDELSGKCYLMPEYSFGLSREMTRADMARFLCTALGYTGAYRGNAAFSDVPRTHPDYDPIMLAFMNGLIGAADEGIYNPDATVNRAQAAKLLTNALKLTADQSAPLPTDVPSNMWYANDVRAVLASGVLQTDADGNYNGNSVLRFGEIDLVAVLAESGYRQIRPEETVIPCGETLPRASAPTDLQWGVKWTYGTDGTRETMTSVGAASWKTELSRDDLRTRFVLWRRGEGGAPDEILVDTRWTLRIENGTAYSTDKNMLRNEYGSGSYYFTVQTLGDGVTCSDSAVVTSTVWDYTAPAQRIPAAANLQIEDDGSFSWDADGTLYSGYEFRYYTPAPGMQADGYNLDGWRCVNSGVYGAGYYACSVRLLSTDITQALSSEWSELSPARHFGDDGLPDGPATPVVTVKDLDVTAYGAYYVQSIGVLMLNGCINGPETVKDVRFVSWQESEWTDELIQDAIGDVLPDMQAGGMQLTPFTYGTGIGVGQSKIGKTLNVLLLALDENTEPVGYFVVAVKVPQFASGGSGGPGGEQYAAPTDLRWGEQMLTTQYDGETHTQTRYWRFIETAGIASWKCEAPSDVMYKIAYYRVGENGESDVCVREENLRPGSMADDGGIRYATADFFVWDAMEAGTYYFTVTAKGSGALSDSMPARSPDWTYVPAQAKLPIPSGLSWTTNGEMCFENLQKSGNNVFGYQWDIYYKDERAHANSGTMGYDLDGWRWVGRYTARHSNSDKDYITLAIYDQAMLSRLEGVYAYRVRTITRDLLNYSSGDWSELSPVRRFGTQDVAQTLGIAVEAVQTLKEATTQQAKKEAYQAAVAALTEVGSAALKESLASEQPGENSTEQLIEALEESQGGKAEANVAMKEPEETASDQEKETFQQLTEMAQGADIIGARLNAEEGQKVELRFSEPEADAIKPLSSEYGKPVQVRLELFAVEEQEGEMPPRETNLAEYHQELAIPVKLKLPVPAGIDPERLTILHHDDEGSILEKIRPTILWEGEGESRKAYASFVVSSFSDFTFAEAKVSVDRVETGIHVRASLTGESLETATSAWCAVYDADGKMLAVNAAPITELSAELTVTCSAAEAETLKLFFLNDQSAPCAEAWLIPLE